MPQYTMFAYEDSVPNSGTQVNGTPGQHWSNVEENDGDGAYIEFAAGQEEWFKVSSVGASGATVDLPADEVVTAARLRITARDPGASGDTLEIMTRLSGVETLVETVIYDSTAMYVSEAFTLSPTPTRAQLLQTQVGVQCTAQTGTKVRVSYLILEVDMVNSGEPIIAGDEDATTM